MSDVSPQSISHECPPGIRLPASACLDGLDIAVTVPRREGQPRSVCHAVRRLIWPSRVACGAAARPLLAHLNTTGTSSCDASRSSDEGMHPPSAYPLRSSVEGARYHEPSLRATASAWWHGSWRVISAAPGRLDTRGQTRIETCLTLASIVSCLRKRTDGGGEIVLCGLGSGRGREGTQAPGLACAGPLGHATCCDPADSLATEASGRQEVPRKAPGLRGTGWTALLFRCGQGQRPLSLRLGLALQVTNA